MSRHLALLACVLPAWACVDVVTPGDIEPAEESSSEAESDTDAESGIDAETDTGSEPPPFPPGSEKLVGDSCDVEILWSTRDDKLLDFVPGEVGEFFVAGKRPTDGGMDQITLRVADGDIAWSASYETGGDPNAISDRTDQRIIRRPDGTLWVFGHEPVFQESWITAYDAQGQLLWEHRQNVFEWYDAVDAGDVVFATARVWAEGLPHDAFVHRLDASGESLWSFQTDGLSIHPWGIAVHDDDVWAVGAIHWQQDCAWRAHFGVDGQAHSLDCPPPVDEGHDGDAYFDVLVLADGTRAVAGRSRITKPKGVGHISYTEPLVSILDEAGNEQHRWTYGPGVYWSGEAFDMAELPDGGFVVISEERDRNIEEDYGSPTIHRFAAAGNHLARCELDRVSIPNYWADFVAVAVGPDAQLYAIVSEGVAVSSDPLDDPDEFPPVPEDFGGHSLVRLSF